MWFDAIKSGRIPSRGVKKYDLVILFSVLFMLPRSHKVFRLAPTSTVVVVIVVLGTLIITHLLLLKDRHWDGASLYRFAHVI